MIMVENIIAVIRAATLIVKVLFPDLTFLIGKLTTRPAMHTNMVTVAII